MTPRGSLRPSAPPQPSSRPALDRISLLEAEVEKLKAARAEDADTTGAMLVRVAEAERSHAAAQARCEALAAELVHAQQRAAAAEARLEATRMTMASAQQMLDEVERREEMAASIRSRTVAQVRAVLGGQGRTAPPPPESSFDSGWEELNIPDGDGRPKR